MKSLINPNEHQQRLRKRAQSTARVSLKRGTKKSPLMDVKQFPQFEPQKYLVDGHLVEVADGQAATLLQNYLQKNLINADNENKLYVQLAQANQSTGPLSEENRIGAELGSLINQQHSAQHSSSTSHLPLKSDSGTGSSTAAVIRVTNLLGAIKGSRNLTEHRQRQYSVTEPNTSSSNDEVVFDYTTVNDGQHSLCLMSGKQFNAIEFDPASLQLASTFQKDSKYDAKSFGRAKVKRQSTPEEASDSSESLVDKETEFSSNNGPHYEGGPQSGDQQQQQAISQTQSVSHPSLAKSFKNRFQHSIFHHPTSSSTPPTTTLSVHYSSSQTSFSNTSSALQQQPAHSTKFSSFNLLRRYRSRFHRANNATCFSNFEASSHSRPSIGVVSATSTPEVTSPSGNSPKAGDQSPSQLPDLKEEPSGPRTINRNYLSATFKSTTCSALSKIAANKSKTMNRHLTASLHTLNVTPAPIHRAKSEDASSYGLLHAVSQKLLEEQTLAEAASSKRRKSLSHKRLSTGSLGTAQPSSSDQTTDNKMRLSNSCLNVSSQTRSNTHRDSTTSNSNQRTSETTQKTSSGQTGQMFTSSSGPSSGVIQPEKVSQNSNISSHSNNSNAISECNQRCLSPASMLQLPHRKHHSDKHKEHLINIGSSESNLTNPNKPGGTSSNSARNHSSNSNYYSYTSTTSTSILTTSQMQLGHGSGGTEQSAAGGGSSFNQSIRHPSNAYSSHSMVKQVWSEKQRISLSKERKAAQVISLFALIKFGKARLNYFLSFFFVCLSLSLSLSLTSLWPLQLANRYLAL